MFDLKVAKIHFFFACRRRCGQMAATTPRRCCKQFSHWLHLFDFSPLCSQLGTLSRQEVALSNNIRTIHVHNSLLHPCTQFSYQTISTPSVYTILFYTICQLLIFSFNPELADCSSVWVSVDNTEEKKDKEKVDTDKLGHWGFPSILENTSHYLIVYCYPYQHLYQVIAI